jgi:hypothetical protein
MRKRVHVLGGGTVYHVRPQFALCSPSFGGTATRIRDLSRVAWGPDYEVHLHLTRMACGGRSDLETNEDIEALLKSLVDDPLTTVVFMAMSLCEFQGHVLEGATATDSGLWLPKLRKPDGRQFMIMNPASDLTAEIRRYRKDLTLVGFRTISSEEGTGKDEEEKEEKVLSEILAAGLSMVESTECNLVLASDFRTKSGMIVSPNRWTSKEDVYRDRDLLLRELVRETHEISLLMERAVEAPPRQAAI